MGSVVTKNKVSNTIVQVTIVAVLAVDSFSWASTKNATAEPPIDVGDTAELNYQMKINSTDFHHENCLSDKIYIRQA